MAHLWLHTEGDWIVFPINGSEVSPPGQEDVRVVPMEEKDQWAVLVRPTPQSSGVYVNGWPLLSGLTILRDGDEIRFGGQDAWFFSTECLARVQAPPGCDPAPGCPRCKQPIATGTESMAVRCPRCDVWYHETVALPCWSYAKTCALCDQPTDLEAGYSWTPETL